MAGTYSDVVENIAPDTAQAGQTVNVTIKIKSKCSDIFTVACIGVYDSEERFIDWLTYNISPGETHSFYGSFVMPYYPPGKVITIHGYSYYYGADNSWHFDDEKTKDVETVAPPTPPSGKIVSKWINKSPEGYELSMPATVKADGNTFEVGVSYKNDSSESITAGCEVKVTRPDGSVVSPAVDWAGMSPGETLSKEYNIAKVNQTGNWLVVIRFLKYSSTELDRFSGVCLIAQTAESTFSNFGMATFSIV